MLSDAVLLMLDICRCTSMMIYAHDIHMIFICYMMLYVST